jgi:acyl-ACP thioesterase
MKSLLIHTDTYKVNSFHSDRFGKLRIHTVANFLQESAWLHSNACGVGYKDLLTIGKMWILSGLKIKVAEYPSWGDELILNTWGNEYEDPLAYRDFELMNSAGRQVICGSTSWLLINISNHRPNRILPEYQKIPPRNFGSGSGKPGRLTAVNEMGTKHKRKVYFSDIDIYNHVNNAKYIEWCTDLIPGEILENYETAEITVNYISESLLDNEIRFNVVATGVSEYIFSAFNETMNREVFRAQMVFRKKANH